MRRCAGLLAALGLVAGQGCAKEATPTQVIVWVDAEPAVRAATARLSLVVLTDEGQPVLDQRLTPEWPVKLALAPERGEASRSYHITARAQTADGETVAQARLSSGYVANDKRFVVLMLEDDCLDQPPCVDPIDTCHAGSCVSAAVPATELGTSRGSAPELGEILDPASEPDGSVSRDASVGKDASMAMDGGGGGSAETGGTVETGGTAETGGTVETGGTAETGGNVETGGITLDPCDMNRGGCDPRVSCSSTSGAVTCGACPAGYDDTRGNGTQCTAVDCGSLSAKAPLSVDAAAGTTYGEQASYSCAGSYILTGVSTRTCEASASWSGTVPSCQADCGGLTSPTNGAVSAPVTTYGERASYSCDAGYSLVGSSTRSCEASANWSDSAPTCPDWDACASSSVCAADYPCTDQSAPSLNYTCRGHYPDWPVHEAAITASDRFANPSGGALASSDSQVLDTLTKLIWQRSDSGTSHTWAEAPTFCAGLSLGSQSWRLPTHPELRSIVDRTVTSAPTIDPTAFPETANGDYWTSSPYALSSGRAWYVRFRYGSSYASDISSTYRVRCVR